MKATRPVRWVHLLIVLALIIMLVPAGSASGTGSVWVGEGPGTITVSDGTTSDPSLHYEISPAMSPNWWTLHTVATSASQVAVGWEYTGLHGWSSVKVKLNAFVTRGEETQEVPILDDWTDFCCISPSNGFSYAGNYTFDLQPGDVYGFNFGGNNGDAGSFINGTLTVHFFNWGGEGPGTVTVSGGSSADPSLQYSLEHGANFPQWWKLYTTATYTGQVAAEWEYSGTHAWFMVHVKLLAFVTRGGRTQEFPILDEYAGGCCNPPSNGFSYSGAYTFADLQPGDVYGFMFGGWNADSNDFLNGTFTMHPIKWMGDGEALKTVSDGLISRPSLHYDLEPAGRGILQLWQLYTTAASAGKVMVYWNFYGNHSKASAGVRLEAYVSRGGELQEFPILNNVGTYRAFTFSGIYTFDLQPGDEYGFKFGGFNDDPANFLHGSLVIQPMTAKVYLPVILAPN